MSFNSDDDSEPGTEEHESPTGDHPSSRVRNPFNIIAFINNEQSIFALPIPGECNLLCCCVARGKV